jgi:hypothetical protein
LWLVVLGWVEDEVAEDLAGNGVDDRDFQVLDEQDDAGSGVGSSDSDVVEFPADPDGHDAGFVDGVVADPVMSVGVAGLTRKGFRQGLVVGCWGGLVGQGPVRPAVVVIVDEPVDEGL